VPSSGPIAGYDIRGLLGSSELTETYRARKAGPQGKKTVALKLLRLDLLSRDEGVLFAQRFLSAGRWSARSPLAGVPAVLDAGECEAGPYIATEIVPGIDLAGLLHHVRRKNPSAGGVPASLAAAIGAQVAHVLGSAHALRAPLFHFGLSPGNVRIGPEGQVRVLDFGHASALRGPAQRRTPKAAFMAPELLREEGTFEGDGPAADAFSLGALLFFLLAGRPPRESGSLTEATATAGALPGLDGVPDTLARAVRALTAADPKQRPRAADEIVDLLGGKASTADREHLIASGLRPLHIPWRSKKDAQGPVQRKSALAARPRWPWKPLLLVAAGAAVLAGGWAGVKAYRHSGGSRAASSLNNKDIKAVRAASTRRLSSAETDVAPRPAIDGGVPSGRSYRPMPKRPLPRVPGHLNIDTVPTAADIWVDGVPRGKTPVDLVLGSGGHRVVLLNDGTRMHKAVYDTTGGEWIRVTLQRGAPSPAKSEAQVGVACRGSHHLPIFIDDEDTGRLCPANIPVAAGPHKIGVFVPLRREIVETKIDVAPGSKPTPVVVTD
jgi:hypothetical protein